MHDDNMNPLKSSCSLLRDSRRSLPATHTSVEGDLNSPGISLLRVDAGNFSKPANTLIRCISRAIGGLYEPTGIVRRARAEAKAKLIEVEGDITASELEQRAARRLIVQEALYQENVESIVEDALPQLDNEARPEDIPDDWYINYFDKARLISDQQMQTVWSGILAGEANTPGSFSRRTVNFLQDMDKSEADLFTLVCGFNVYSDTFSPLIFDVDDDIYRSEGLNYAKLSLLDSIGLINFNNIAGFVLKGQQGKRIAFSYYDRNFTMKVGDKSDGNIRLGKVMLTRVGQELAPICGSTPVSGFEPYLLRNWQEYSPTLID